MTLMIEHAYQIPKISLFFKKGFQSDLTDWVYRLYFIFHGRITKMVKMGKKPKLERTLI